MKNKSVRLILTSFIIALSIGSFVYLNSNVETNLVETQSIETTEQIPSAEAMTLPDIQVTKGIVKFAKKLLPISQ